MDVFVVFGEDAFQHLYKIKEHNEILVIHEDEEETHTRFDLYNVVVIHHTEFHKYQHMFKNYKKICVCEHEEKCNEDEYDKITKINDFSYLDYVYNKPQKRIPKNINYTNLASQAKPGDLRKKQVKRKTIPKEHQNSVDVLKKLAADRQKQVVNPSSKNQVANKPYVRKPHLRRNIPAQNLDALKKLAISRNIKQANKNNSSTRRHGK